VGLLVRRKEDVFGLAKNPLGPRPENFPPRAQICPAAQMIFCREEQSGEKMM
jgi:hypothetical protein